MYMLQWIREENVATRRDYLLYKLIMSVRRYFCRSSHFRDAPVTSTI